MADRPIIFSAPMIRALIEGRKTQTRRVLKPQPYQLPGFPGHWNASGQIAGRLCVSDRHLLDLHCKPRQGDRLYVREAFAMNPAVRRPDRTKNVIYRADAPAKEPPAGNCLTMDVLLWSEAKELKWKPSIHMPRWASRLTLTVTDVRVQRLQDISEADARAEGWKSPEELGCNTWCPRGWFADLWRTLHGADAWDANPWVVAVSFTVEQRNIDAGGGA